jgi:hypothetical protein
LVVIVLMLNVLCCIYSNHSVYHLCIKELKIMTQKHLSYSAILVLAANTMNGPGITTLPDVAVDAGLFLYIFLIVVSVKMASFVCARMVFAMWSSVNNAGGYVGYDRVESVESDVKSLFEEEDGKVMPDSSIQLTDMHPNQQLEHREHKQDPQSKLVREDSLEGSGGGLEADSLLDHDHKLDVAHRQPLIERTSIVGQSFEGYGHRTSTVVALTMVASALW